MRSASLFIILGCIPLLIRGATAVEPDPTPVSSSVVATPWLVPWGHRMSVTVTPDSVSGTHDDFPVVLVLDSGQQPVFDAARSDGADLAVTGSDGLTTLAREVVEYDPIGHHAEIWFRAETLSSTDNVFYLYYGNASADSPLSDGSVWTSNFLGVYHCEGDPGSQVLRDSSPGARHGLAGNLSDWKSSDVTAGQIGQAWAFNGVNHSVSGRALSTTDSSYVISTWADLAKNSTDFAFQANPDYWHVSFQASGVNPRPHFAMNNPDLDLRWKPDPVPIDGQYHHYAWVFDGVADTILFYFDGILQPATDWWNPSGVPYYTGRPVNPDGTDGIGIAGPMFYNDGDLVEGGVDEFRFSEGTRSGGWIATQYRNQRSPGTFVTFGPEEDDLVFVALIAFDAERSENGARIQWTIADPEGNAGFHVYREEENGVRKRLTTGLLTGRQSYEFHDPHPPSTATRYWLSEVSRTGEIRWLGPAVLSAASPFIFTLAQNTPNPFAGSSVIRFTLEKETQVRLSVFNSAGQLVASLIQGTLPAGPHQFRWDGHGDTGGQLAPGVYIYRLDAGGKHRGQKMVILP